MIKQKTVSFAETVFDCRKSYVEKLIINFYTIVGGDVLDAPLSKAKKCIK